MTPAIDSRSRAIWNMQLFVIGTRNGGQVPAAHLLNVSFPGPAWVNGGSLGTEASFLM
ncbi:MAG: hypothetical protein WA431_04225 [Candidatus Cybelea sp.]